MRHWLPLSNDDGMARNRIDSHHSNLYFSTLISIWTNANSQLLLDIYLDQRKCGNWYDSFCLWQRNVADGNYSVSPSRYAILNQSHTCWFTHWGRICLFPTYPIRMLTFSLFFVLIIRRKYNVRQGCTKITNKLVERKLNQHKFNQTYSNGNISSRNEKNRMRCRCLQLWYWYCMAALDVRTWMCAYARLSKYRTRICSGRSRKKNFPQIEQNELWNFFRKLGGSRQKVNVNKPSR